MTEYMSIEEIKAEMTAEELQDLFYDLYADEMAEAAGWEPAILVLP